MGSLRGWLGSFLSFSLFALARRFCYGFAAPCFLVAIFACAYIWVVVLRVPELRKPLEPDADRKPFVPRESSASVGEKKANTETGASSPVGVKQSVTTAAVPGNSASSSKEISSSAAAVPHEEGGVDEKAQSGGGTAPPLQEPLQTETQTVPPTANSEQMLAEPAAGAAGAESATFGKADRAAAAAASATGEIGGTPAPATATEPADAASADAIASPGQAAAEADVPTEDSDASADEQKIVEDEADYVDPQRAQELRLEGNDFFKAGKLHDAREAYSEAIYLTPLDDKKDKAVLYCNRAACMQKLERWDDVVGDCKLAIELDPEYVKAYVRRSTAYEAQTKWHDATEDLKKAIELDPSLRSKEYKHLAVLEKRAQEQFEKDKDEMLGKLKDLGNTVLGKFGMSTDNFKLEQDPNSGGYSIKYNQ